MYSLYTLNYNLLLALSMLFVLDLVLQALCVIRAYLSSTRNLFYLGSISLNIAIFAQIGIYLLTVAKDGQG